MAFGYKPLSEDRYLPAPPSTVFAALQAVASEKCNDNMALGIYAAATSLGLSPMT